MSRPLAKEDSVEELLVRRVRALGGRCEKMAMKGRRGFPDRLVILPGGRIHLVETKRPVGGRLLPHQISLHAIYKALGATVAVVRNSEDIDRLLSSSDTGT
jgi:hypothetical protein